MNRGDLTTAQWERLQPLLPPQDRRSGGPPMTRGRSSMACCGSCAPVPPGAICPSAAEAYMQRTVELRYNAAQAAMHWLEGKVGEERKRIERADQPLLSFREREGILSLEGGQEILVKKIATLNDMYIHMRVKRLEMESQTQMTQQIAKDPKLTEAFPLVMQNQFIQTLKANDAILAQDLSELSDR
jgi:uncharacterized protein involved in exopolysaccharide biosynthesis